MASANPGPAHTAAAHTVAPRPSKKQRLEGIPYPFASLLLPSPTEGPDVVIEIEGERFEVHEAILSAASPVLKVMLTSGMRESVSKTIVLDSNSLINMR